MKSHYWPATLIIFGILIAGYHLFNENGFVATGSPAPFGAEDFIVYLAVAAFFGFAWLLIYRVIVFIGRPFAAIYLAYTRPERERYWRNHPEKRLATPRREATRPHHTPPNDTTPNTTAQLERAEGVDDTLPDVQVAKRPNGPQGEAAWDQLILEEGTKGELRSMQKLLCNPEALERTWGVRFTAKGLILSGPPGTGKTSIAKALAASAGYAFYAVDPATLKQQWVGQSEKVVKRVYDAARKNAPAIVFLDEIDAVASKRSDTGTDAGGGGRAANGLVNQLLQEIDGFNSDEQIVFTVAATNRPDHLDDALKSRLNYNIEIPLPNENARRALLELYLRHIIQRRRLAVPVELLVSRTDGMSGRDIKNLADAIPQIAMGLDAEVADITIIDRAFKRVVPPTKTRRN